MTLGASHFCERGWQAHTLTVVQSNQDEGMPLASISNTVRETILVTCLQR